jgi:hypothetical protein
MEAKAIGSASKLPISFTKYQKIVLRDLRSPTFAAEPYSQPEGARSAAAKELERKHASRRFTKDFLKQSYNVLREHARLRHEQQLIRNLTEEQRPKLVKLKNALNTIKSMKKRLAEVKRNVGWLIDPAVWGQTEEALADCERQLRSREESLSAMLHPAKRKSYASKVHWEPVLKAYDYELPSLKKKAPDQWLYRTLHDVLMKELAEAKITDMTRYRIMSSLLSPCGIKVQPITFKLFFEAVQRKPAVKKVRST